MVQRVLEAVVFVVGLRAATGRAGVPWFDAGLRVLVAAVRGRPVPVVSLAITIVLLTGVVVEAAWPRALDTLARTPGGPWWQDLTAPFVQGNGVPGTVFNVLGAALVLALAEWFWGRTVAAGTWLLGAWAPVGAVAGLVGYHVSEANVHAYSSGSSGATYFTLGTLCVAAALAAPDRATRVTGCSALAIALVMWVVVNDGHGVLLVEGGLLGLVLLGLRAAARRPVREGCSA